VAAWWRRGAIYQIYPRSFADGDGDGVGDLAGIREHLDHVASLGASAVWLSPIFPSPMADFGYDVSDHCDVDPVFGTLDDFDALLAACHERGLRLILDWIPNHTSAAHPWFVASRSSREDPHRDWYVWRDPAPDGGPPNDWTSRFDACGPAWTLDPATGQCFLHSFLPEQPDLNWDNPAVEAAMHDTIRFWLDRGVDGLRLDAIHRIAKDPALRSNAGYARPRDEDWETIHERLRRIRAVVDAYEDRMIVGEVAIHDLPRVVSYVVAGDQLHLAHNFVFIELPWDARAFRASIDEFEELADLHTWPAWFLENHDNPRVVARFGDGGHGPARARAVLVMLHALRGTPFLFQGQELGLPGADIPPDRVVDVDGRDPVRAPIPWRRPSAAGPAAGFSAGTPWLPLVQDAETLCVEAQEDDPASALTLTRALGRLRATSAALEAGDQTLAEPHPSVLAWMRTAGDERLFVAVNFAPAPSAVELPAAGTVVLSSDAARAAGPQPAGPLELGPTEAVILRLG
jgi:alpha-glucosidase